MKRLYTLIRTTGYAAGILGVLLTLGSRANPSGNKTIQAAGGICLLIMVVCLFTSYLIYASVSLRNRR